MRRLALESWGVLVVAVIGVGMIAYGVRRMTGARPDFAAVWGRRPAIRIELVPGSQYGRLVVTVADPDATLVAVRRGLRPGTRA